jgi:hypothetical protein
LSRLVWIEWQKSTGLDHELLLTNIE